MKQHTKPCGECPFRRKSVRGYTGDEPILPADHRAVFSTVREFIEHHAGEGAWLRTWRDDKDARNNIRVFLGLEPLGE